MISVFKIEDRFTYDSGIPFDEMAEIQANLTEEEDNAIEQARTAIQQLRKIQQLKLEAVARAACGDNHYSDILPEVHQQTCSFRNSGRRRIKGEKEEYALQPHSGT